MSVCRSQMFVNMRCRIHSLYMTAGVLHADPVASDAEERRLAVFRGPSGHSSSPKLPTGHGYNCLRRFSVCRSV